MRACIQARNINWKANIMYILVILDVLSGSVIGVRDELLLIIGVRLIIAPLSPAVCGRKVVQLDKLLIDKTLVIKIQTAQHGNSSTVVRSSP